MFEQLLINGVMGGVLISLLATGFSLIYKTTGIFHVAYGATYTLAAYLFYALLVEAKLPLHVVIPAVWIATMATGVVMERLVFLPLGTGRASLLTTLLSSLGLYIIAVNLIALWFGSDTKMVGLSAMVTYEVGSSIISRLQLMQAGGSALLLILTFLLLHFTSIGLAVRAIRDDVELATALGDRPARVRAMAVAGGTLLGASAAMLNAAGGTITPHDGLPVVLLAAVATIVGGAGTFAGPALGGLVLGILGSVVAWLFSSKWIDAAVFGLLIGFLLFRPEGLLRAARRAEEATA
jgi:branched-chain amino acid transport system permease protein